MVERFYYEVSVFTDDDGVRILNPSEEKLSRFAARKLADDLLCDLMTPEERITYASALIKAARQEIAKRPKLWVVKGIATPCTVTLGPIEARDAIDASLRVFQALGISVPPERFTLVQDDAATQPIA